MIPFSAVDAKTEQAIIDTIQKERKTSILSIIVSSPSFVGSYQADWIIVWIKGRL